MVNESRSTQGRRQLVTGAILTVAALAGAVALGAIAAVATSGVAMYAAAGGALLLASVGAAKAFGLGVNAGRTASVVNTIETRARSSESHFDDRMQALERKMDALRGASPSVESPAGSGHVNRLLEEREHAALPASIRHQV